MSDQMDEFRHALCRYDEAKSRLRQAMEETQKARQALYDMHDSVLGAVTRVEQITNVVGVCPACGMSLLFVGEGGYITCANDGCPRPDAASSELLAMKEDR